MKKQYILIILLLGVGVAYGQSLFEPNYALKRPQTLEIVNIDLQKDVTILNLSIENLIEDGYFCIDPETYIVTDSGKRLKLTGLTGLPFCPATYKFSRVGEIKYLTMKFPALDSDVKWIDIIEECGENCLSVYGIILEPKLNAEINICFRDIENGRVSDAIMKFEELRSSLTGSGNPILGSIYLNLIYLYNENNDIEKATDLENQFRSILIPHKELFMEGVN